MASVGSKWVLVNGARGIAWNIAWYGMVDCGLGNFNKGATWEFKKCTWQPLFWECWIFSGTLNFWTLQGDLTKSSEHGRELEEFWPLKAIMAEDDLWWLLILAPSMPMSSGLVSKPGLAVVWFPSSNVRSILSNTGFCLSFESRWWQTVAVADCPVSCRWKFSRAVCPFLSCEWRPSGFAKKNTTWIGIL